MRKAVRSIGRCAINIEDAADQSIQVLTDLIRTRVPYVVQEAIIVIKVFLSLMNLRIYLEGIQIDMRGLLVYCVNIWILWMILKQKHP